MKNLPVLQRNLIIIALLTTCFALFSCAHQQSDPLKQADYYYKVGTAYLNEGNNQSAFIEFQKAYQLDPNNKEVLNGLGIIYIQLDDFDKAHEMFQRAVSADPLFSEAANNLGIVYMKKREWEKAVKVFLQALSNPVYKTPELPYYSIGMSYYRMGNYDTAAEYLKGSIKRSPQFPAPYYSLALALNKSGNYGDSSISLSRAIEIDPQYKGNKGKFLRETKQRLLTARGEEEQDFRDFLEIMQY